MLECIGGIIPQEIHGKQINHLSNIITLNGDHHSTFHSLYWWMELVSSGVRIAWLLASCHSFLSPQDPHHYVIRHVSPIVGLPDEVRFSSTNPLLELPDPKFIAIHAACCRAAHLSGAAEDLDHYYRAIETTRVLANNGSSIKLLEFGLADLVVAS